MLPEGWSTAAFGEVVDIAEGQVDPREEPYRSMMHVGPDNVATGSGQLSSVQTCADLGLISGKYRFDENAVVYSKIRPELMKACRPRFDGVCSADMYPLWPKNGQLDPDFLFYLMLGPEFSKAAIARSMRTGMPKINREDLTSIKVSLPPHCEQSKIATMLGTWDQAIETVDKLIDNARARKKALMQRLLTGKRRLPGFEGEWEEATIATLEDDGWLTLGRGKVISKKDVAAFAGDHPIYSSSVKNEGLFARYGDFMFDEELITWSVDGGGDFFHRSKHKFSVTNVSGYMRLDESRLNYRFVASQLQYSHARQVYDYQSKAHPSVIRTRYMLKLPPLKEQAAIAAVLSTADVEISDLEQMVAKLGVEKRALMQQLLTGKRRVKVGEAE